jgi:hypothetical protein
MTWRKALAPLLGGRPMAFYFRDIVSHRPIFIWRDEFGRSGNNTADAREKIVPVPLFKGETMICDCGTMGIIYMSR